MLEIGFQARIENFESTSAGATIVLRVICQGISATTLEAMGKIPLMQQRSRVKVMLSDDESGSCICEDTDVELERMP